MAARKKTTKPTGRVTIPVAKKPEPGEALPAVQTGGKLQIPETTNEITRLLEMGIKNKMDADTMEKIVGLHERISATQARGAFAMALADFQASCPPVPKTSLAEIKDRDTGIIKFSYDYAKLESIAAFISPHIRPVGLSYTFDTKTEDDQVEGFCRLLHIMGHSETSSAKIPINRAAKQQTPSQQWQTASTVAKRNALVEVLGLTTAEDDTDGATPESDIVITESQAADLRALREEVKADGPAFLRLMRVSRLEDIRACDYTMAVKALESKRGQA